MCNSGDETSSDRLVPHCQSGAGSRIPIEPHCVLWPQWKALKLVYLSPMVPLGWHSQSEQPAAPHSSSSVAITHTPRWLVVRCISHTQCVPSAVVFLVFRLSPALFTDSRPFPPMSGHLLFI